MHAEHRDTLEEMRDYYMLREDDENDKSSPVAASDQTAAAAVNGKGSGFFGTAQDDDDGVPSFLSRSLDWRTLLGLTPDPASTTTTR